MIEDFGIAPLADETVRDSRWRSLEDRYDRRSTLIPSQLPLGQWHAYLGDRTVADVMLDRLVHHSYRLVLKGDSMRKHRGSALKSASPTTHAAAHLFEFPGVWFYPLVARRVFLHTRATQISHTLLTFLTRREAHHLSRTGCLVV